MPGLLVSEAGYWGRGVEGERGRERTLRVCSSAAVGIRLATIIRRHSYFVVGLIVVVELSGVER